VRAYALQREEGKPLKPHYSEEHLRFLTYLKAVCSGPEANRDLTYDEARDAFESILRRAVPDEAIGAYLVGWRVKPENEEEMRASLDAIHNSFHAETKADGGVEIGYPMEGKCKTAPLMLKSAELLDNLHVHVTGDDRQSPRFGFNPKHFHEEMGFCDNLDYHERRIFAPELSRLTPLRNSLGIRSTIDTIEKLNFLAPSALIGIDHAPHFELYAELYAPFYRRLLIVQGDEGTPELSKKTKMLLVDKEERREFTVDPAKFGIGPVNAEEPMTLEAMVEQLERPDANLKKLIVLNAALLGFAAGLYDSVESGYNALTK
jgi:anthranilate phosphoribosyltransferase